MKRSLWGVILIALGVVILLQRFGIFPFGFSFWSLVLLGVGLWLISSGFGRRGPDWFTLALGVWVGAMGLFSILNDAGLVPVDGGMIARNGWPILIIALGVSIVFGRGPVVVVNSRGRTRESRHQVVGDLNYGSGEHWVLDGDLVLEHSVGDVKVDLTTADITPGSHRIVISQSIGEVVVKVPDNVTVRASGESSIGEIDVLGTVRSGMGLSAEKTVTVPESPVELVVEVQVRVGSLRISRVPAPIQVIG